MDKHTKPLSEVYAQRSPDNEALRQLRANITELRDDCQKAAALYGGELSSASGAHTIQSIYERISGYLDGYLSSVHAERATVSRKQLAEMLDELVRERSIVQRGRILDFVCSDPGECQSPAVNTDDQIAPQDLLDELDTCFTSKTPQAEVYDACCKLLSKFDVNRKQSSGSSQPVSSKSEPRG